MPYDCASAWRRQLEDMDKQDSKQSYHLENKIYPHGLFNLTSNPHFSLFSQKRKLCAIYNVLQNYRPVIKTSIWYLETQGLVLFDTHSGLVHQIDLAKRHVQILETCCDNT